MSRMRYHIVLQELTTLSSRRKLPLIVTRHASKNANRATQYTTACNIVSFEEEGISNENTSVATTSILDFPPEQVASSIVDLWDDLTSRESRREYLRFQKGWVVHAILLGCPQDAASETVERVIEIACCLDLLCLQHDLAVALIEALTTEALARLTAWTRVRPSLIPKMNEILTGSLSHGLDGARPFRVPRSEILERWILSRPYFNEDELYLQSLQVDPRESSTDVDVRISELESIVRSLDQPIRNIESSREMEMNDFTANFDECISDLEFTSDSDTDLSSSSTSDIEDFNPEAPSALAFKTREHVTQRLIALTEEIHLRSTLDSSPS